MISWHNCPKWEYMGFTYGVEIDEDPDDQSRKAWHYVYDKDGKEVACIDHSPYQFLTRDEFTYHIDMLFLDPYDNSAKQGALT